MLNPSRELDHGGLRTDFDHQATPQFQGSVVHFRCRAAAYCEFDDTLGQSVLRSTGEARLDERNLSDFKPIGRARRFAAAQTEFAPALERSENPDWRTRAP